VFELPHSSTSSSATHTVDPVVNIVLGVLILVTVAVAASGRDKRRQAWVERRREKAKDKGPPRWRRQLSKGSMRDTFIVGALLSFPGASYILGMNRLHDQHIGTGATVLAVVLFSAIQLTLLELPLIGYATNPDRTTATVQKFGDWLPRNGGRIALIAGTAIGIILIGRGIINW
jgi:Sap, sulfolipid-1-addressing protein